jgi:hypothetical protein
MLVQHNGSQIFYPENTNGNLVWTYPEQIYTEQSRWRYIEKEIRIPLKSIKVKGMVHK